MDIWAEWKRDNRRNSHSYHSWSNNQKFNKHRTHILPGTTIVMNCSASFNTRYGWNVLTTYSKPQHNLHQWNHVNTCEHQRTHLETSESITKHKQQNARLYLAQYMFTHKCKSKNTEILHNCYKLLETYSGTHESKIEEHQG